MYQNWSHDWAYITQLFYISCFLLYISQLVIANLFPTIIIMWIFHSQCDFKYHNCNLISHNNFKLEHCDFIYDNCNLMSHNCCFFSYNYDFISHNVTNFAIVPWFFRNCHFMFHKFKFIFHSCDFISHFSFISHNYDLISTTWSFHFKSDICNF